jgi:amino acid permease
MSYKTLRSILEWVVMILMAIGIVAAAFDLTLGGFTPIVWLLISLWALLMIICTEVSQIRESLGKKK